MAELRALLAYLMKLSSEDFYGEVTIRFRGGKVHGSVKTLQEHLPTALPEPDVLDEKYQIVLKQTVSGVS